MLSFNIIVKNTGNLIKFITQEIAPNNFDTNLWLRDVIVKNNQTDDYNINNHINPPPPSDAIRKQKKYVLEDFFSSILSQLKNYHPSGNLK